MRLLAIQDRQISVFVNRIQTSEHFSNSFCYTNGNLGPFGHIFTKAWADFAEKTKTNKQKTQAFFAAR